MLTFKHAIVHLMVIQILVLNILDFVCQLLMQQMNLRQWASSLSSEVEDVVVP